MRKILLVTFGIAISLSICEILLRIFVPITTLKFYNNPIIGSALVPNQSGLFVTESKEYKNVVSVNSEGWPDVFHSLDKPSGIYRILILGDSFVENWQVPFEHRFFRQLQRSLGDKYEVIALGRGNTGTYHQNLILKNYGLKYKPDLVIHMFLTANDIKDNSVILHPNLYQVKTENRLKNIFKQFRIIKMLLSFRQKYQENKVNSSAGYPVDYHVYSQTYSQEYDDAWNKTKNLILESKRMVEETGSKYLLVTLANNEQVNKKVLDEIYIKYPKARDANLDLEKPDKLIYEFASKENINLFQMLPSYLNFAKNNPDKLTHYFYDGHWTKDGTDLAYKLLLNQIIPQD